MAHFRAFHSWVSGLRLLLLGLFGFRVVGGTLVVVCFAKDRESEVKEGEVEATIFGNEVVAAVNE